MPTISSTSSMSSIKTGLFASGPLHVLASCGWSVRNAFSTCPVLSTIATLMTVAISLVPSAQTVFVSRMVSHIEDGGTALAWACATGLVVAGYLAAQQIMYTVQRMVQISIGADCYKRIDHVYAGLEPRRIADPAVIEMGRQAREAIDSGKLPMQPVSLLSTLFSVLVCVSLTVTLWRTSWIAALLVLATLLPLTVSMMVYSREDAKRWPGVTSAQRTAEYRESMLTYQSTAQELSLYDAGPTVAGWAARGRDSYRDLRIGLESLSIASDGLAGLASVVLLAGALVAMIASGSDASLIAGGTTGILSGIIATSNVGYSIGELLTSTTAVTAFQRFVRSGDDGPRPAALPSGSTDAASLVVRDLSVFHPGNDRPTVSGVDLSLDKGQMVAFVGTNGAGKTTTIKGLIGMLDVSCDELRIGGDDLTRSGYAQRHRYFGVVPQEYGRYELTVRENLSLGDTAAIRDDRRLWRALRTARADGFVAKLPHGLDSQLGDQWGGAGLSGGEWQRLALARLALRDAPIRILDEATSNIDAETEESLFRDLRADAGGYITIVVSHRVWTLRDMDRIYVFDGGRIVESGTYKQLDRPGTRFAELFAFQERNGGGAQASAGASGL